jgi:Ca2+-binding EF-hand superfamily protein
MFKRYDKNESAKIKPKSLKDIIKMIRINLLKLNKLVL